jgi:hypothetical protein
MSIELPFDFTLTSEATLSGRLSLGSANLRLPLRYKSEVPRCVISVHRCASTLFNGRATLRSKGDLLPMTILLNTGSEADS